MNKVKAFIIFVFVVICLPVYGQTDKVKFWANARGFQQNARLGDRDTINTSKNSSGYVLGDIGLNVNPLKNTEIQTIIRVRAALGGFYGDGSTVTLRRLNVKGLLANVVGYEVGDLYLKLSPYTLYNTYAEGAVNEATVFRDLRRDIINYDLFYRENYWWQQGAHVNFATGFKTGFIDKIKYDAFVTRNRWTPTMRLSAGGRVVFMSKDKFALGLNYINLFDDRAVSPYLPGTNNPVYTSELMYKFNVGENELVVNAEGGYSQLYYKNPLEAANLTLTKTKYEDFFTDASLGFNIPSKSIKIRAGYRYVGPDFRSSGAQTKRINFAANPEYFLSVANDPFTQRNINLFDITRSQSVYNVVITPQLMQYDPRLANTMPYGVATPNRQGVYGEVSCKDSLKPVDVTLKAFYMMDAVGYGATDKRHFQLYQAAINIKMHQLLSWNKQFMIYGGAQYEHTNRDGNISAVKLNSVLVDAGLDLELFNKFYVIGGLKVLRSKGNEFLLSIDQFNQYGSAVFFVTNSNQQLLGYGLKYKFGKNTYLSLQNQNFIYKDKSNGNKDYSFDQLFVMFYMNF